MAPPSQQLDKYGFPIPGTFEPPREPRPRRRVSPRTARWIVLLVAGGMVLLGTRGFWKARLNESVAEYYERRGRERQLLDDLPGALADFDSALAWAPDQVGLYYWRAIARLESHDVEGSLRDCDQLLSRNPFPEAYQLRSQANQRLGKHDEALADSTQYLELADPQDPNPWNNRAYVRALAGRELNEALTDIERAIQLGGPSAAFLDTRGYILFLLGQYDRALADLDEAITEAGQDSATLLQAARARSLADGTIRRLERGANENLSVLMHHRGQIREALGKKDEAQADYRAAEELGYNPAKGVM